MKGKVCDLFYMLKVGTKVMVECSDRSLIIEGIIGYINKFKDIYVFNNTYNGRAPCGYETMNRYGYDFSCIVPYTSLHTIEILESNKSKSEEKTMSLIQKFKQIFLTEPTKSFIKSGIINDDGFLTSDGKEVFIKFLLDKHADEFKEKIVDKILEEIETDKK